MLAEFMCIGDGGSSMVIDTFKLVL